MTLTDVAALMNLGGLGIVAYLLLQKVDVRLSALERAVNRFVLVTALDLVSRPDTSKPVKEEARRLISDVRREPSSTGEPSLFQEGAD